MMMMILYTWKVFFIMICLQQWYYDVIGFFGGIVKTCTIDCFYSAVQPPRSSFQYASPRLWNQFPASLRQPRTNLSNSASPSSLSGTSPSTHHFHHPSPLHSFIPGLKLSFSANPSTVAYHFFFRTNSTDSPDCLPILRSISVFTF